MTPLKVARQAAQEAGEVLLSLFGQGDRGQLKGRGNVVTQADYAAERAILARLRQEFPDYGVISEESEAVATSSPYTWVVDPLDGSNNFSFGLPFFSVSIALLREGEGVLGVTYDPLRREAFWAERGRGAFLNGSPLRVSQKEELISSLVGFDMGYNDARGGEMLDFARRLWPGVFSFRIMGSGALGLAYVAAGRLDLYLHRWLYPWDLSAGLLLVEEAGGVVTDWQGQPLSQDSREVIATNPTLHREVMARLAVRP